MQPVPAGTSWTEGRTQSTTRGEHPGHQAVMMRWLASAVGEGSMCHPEPSNLAGVVCQACADCGCASRVQL